MDDSGESLSKSIVAITILPDQWVTYPNLPSFAKIQVAALVIFHKLMADQPTGLPIQESLINDSQTLAQELQISWSRLVTLALQDFIRRYRKRPDLVAEINAAYADDLDEDETRLIQTMRTSHRHLVEGEW